MVQDTRDIALKISATTSGSDQVNALARQLDALAREGGAAAPEIARLAEEFRRIGSQDAAVATMARLQAELDQTARAFEAARTRAGQLDAALTAQRERTEALRRTQAGTREALNATAREVRETRAAMDLLRASSDASTKKSAEYRSEMVRLGTELSLLRAKQAELRAEEQAANAALAAGERALRSAAAAYQAADREAAQFGRTLDQQRTALDNARAAARQIGVTADDVATAQAEVAAALDQTRAAALREVAAFEQLARIQQHLATSNAANVAAARQAAAARVNAAQQVVAAEQAAQRATDAAALSARLAAQQQEAAARETAAAAQRTQRALQEAFGVIGVRSAQTIQDELDRVRRAMDQIRNTAGASGTGLAQAMDRGEERVRRLERELRAANGQLTLTDRLAQGLNSSIGQFTAGALFANVLQNIAVAAQELGREAVQANVDLQKLQLGLKAVYGSAETTAHQVEFLRSTAQQAGVSVGEVSGAFIKFAASAQSAGVPMSQVNGLFAALSKNAAILGLSGDKVADMLNALGQMAGKGVVQMEELRGQLGDALPGALPKVAQGLGITVLEMEKLSRNGELLASEVFPALQRVLEEQTGEVDTISARWARFKNVMSETAQDLGQGVLGQALGAFAAGVGRTLEHLAFTATLISEGFTQAAKNIGIAASDVVEQGLKFRGFSDTAKAAFKEVDEEGNRRLEQLAARIDGTATAGAQSFQQLGQASAHAGQEMRVVGDQITYVTTQSARAAPALTANASAHAATATAAGQNAAAQTAAGTAASTSSRAAAGATGAWTQLTVAYTKVNEVQAQQALVSKANLEAKKAEGAAAIDLARLSGNEAAVRAATAAATVNEAAAQAELTAALERQLGVLRAQRDAEVALYNDSVRRGAAEQVAQREAIEALNRTIEVKDQEVRKNRELTESLRAESSERRVATESLRDNASRVNELREAYTTAAAKVETMNRLQAAGKVTTDQAAEAKRAAAAAERLYNDALSDQIARQQEAARAQQANFTLQEQTLRLALEEARTAEEVARAKGDLKTAAEASNNVKRLEIELLRLQAQAQRAEAEALLAALPAKRLQLELEGKLTEAMKKSLEAEELAAKAKLKSAEITEEMANRTERVAAATRAASDAAAGSAGGFDAMGDAMERAAGSADRLGQSLRRTRGGTTFGPGEAPVAGADGRPVEGLVQRTVVGQESDAIATLRQKRDAGLLSTSDKGAAEAAFLAESANAATLSGVNSAFVSPQAVQQAAARAQDAKAILDTIQAMERRSNAPAAAAGAGQPEAGRGASYVVNVDLNGSRTAINTASQTDANNLAGLLQQLGNASQRSVA